MLQRNLNGILNTLFKLAKTELSDYVELEQVENSVFFTEKGSLGSIIEIKGVQAEIDDVYFSTSGLQNFYNSIKSLLEQKGYSIEFVYVQDKTYQKKHFEEKAQVLKDGAKHNGIDLDFIVDSRKEILNKQGVVGRVYLIVKTSLSVLEKTQAKNDKELSIKQKLKELRDIKLLNKQFNDLDGVDEYALYKAHITFLDTVLKAVQYSGVYAGVLDCDRVLSYFSDMISNNGYLLTDYHKEGLYLDESLATEEEVLTVNEKHKKPLTDTTVKVIDFSTCIIGENVYKPFYIDVLPKIEQNNSGFQLSFNSLLDILNNRMKIQENFRISVRLESGKDAFSSLKNLNDLLRLFSMGNNNHLIDSAVETLRVGEKLKLLELVKVRFLVTLWDKVKYKKVGDDLELDIRAIENSATVFKNQVRVWGDSLFLQNSPDPILLTLNTVGGLTDDYLAKTHIAPLEIVKDILPLNKVTSAWDNGNNWFLTTKNSLFEYSTTDQSKQTASVTLVYAPMGSGKSMLGNYLNLNLLLDKNCHELPYLRVIDIGASAFGVLNLIKETLPENKKHEVVALKLSNTVNNTVNVFDTNLGCRTPTARELEFLKNFLAILLSNEKNELPLNAKGLLEVLIKETYLAFAISKDQKRFVYGLDEIVEHHLQKADINVSENTTWWELVDYFFLKGDYATAKRCQLYAMPRLVDLPLILSKSNFIRNSYGNALTETGESLVDVVRRRFSEVINEFPILSGVTKTSLGNAKVAVIDLEEVTSNANAKTKSIFYMLATNILCKDFFLKETPTEKESLQTPTSDPRILNYLQENNVPVNEYREFHSKEFKANTTRVKRLVMDELHTTEKNPFLMNDLIGKVRVGRKYNIEIMLLSQLLNDFTKELIDLSTVLYILASISKDEVDKLSPIFSFSNTEKRQCVSIPQYHCLIRLKTTTPPFKGSPWSNYLVKAVLSPAELWAFETKNALASVRNELVADLGLQNAIKVLSTLYPNPNSVLNLAPTNTDDLTKEQMALFSRQIAEQIKNRAIANGII